MAKRSITIILHTSKTMRTPVPSGMPRTPSLMGCTLPLASYLQTLEPEQIKQAMHVSTPLASKTHAMFQAWDDRAGQSYAIDSFVGDIYSGLRASTLDGADRDYADMHLRILSGLYGILRPYDGVKPYRLEMGYRLPDEPYRSLYTYWGKAIASKLPAEGPIINLAAVEYSRAFVPHVGTDRVVSPRFLTINPTTNRPEFVVVHAKIARGAFARWLITSRITGVLRLREFADIGYQYNQELSTPAEPVFVCRTFGGKGLSMRLQPTV